MQGQRRRWGRYTRPRTRTRGGVRWKSVYRGGKRRTEWISEKDWIQSPVSSSSRIKKVNYRYTLSFTYSQKYIQKKGHAPEVLRGIRSLVRAIHQQHNSHILVSLLPPSTPFFYSLHNLHSVHVFTPKFPLSSRQKTSIGFWAIWASPCAPIHVAQGNNITSRHLCLAPCGWA